MGHRINLIAAVAEGNRVIGNKGRLPWHIPEDLQHFKTLTTGHPVIMGRKTWESIPPTFRPLSGRTNIIVTRDGGYQAEGALVATSFPEALSRAKEAEGSEEIFAIGGREIYECALPFASRLYLTLVQGIFEGDAFFPAYDEFTKEVACEERNVDGLTYSFLTLERG